ncbi:MAG: hypothetical protein IJP03_02445 [Christensenellaceae bacterium]|nr:hypothetical protein [Christensenellaceae bacterium]
MANAKLKKHPIFNSFKALFRLFKPKPEIIELGENNGQPTIYVANHAAANGPFTYELFFPRRFVPWGAHQMCGNIRERWNYLYHIFYRQKKGYGKVKAFLIATPFCVISKMLYNGAELIPTYHDLRLKKSIHRSIEALKAGQSVLIFPENSEDVGYQEVIDKFHRGFVTLAKRFRAQTGAEAPICPVYYNGRKNRMVIDTPVFLKDLLEKGLHTDELVAEFFRDRVNQLNAEHAGV